MGRLHDFADKSLITTNEIIDELWNPVVNSFLQDAIDKNKSNPYSVSNSKYEVGVIDKLCEAVLDNDLMEILHNVNYPVKFPFKG